MIQTGAKIIATLSDFNSIAPSVILPQEEVLARVQAAHTRAIESAGGSSEAYRNMYHRYGAKNTQIATRGFENVALSLDSRDALEKNIYFGKRAQEIFTEFYLQQTRPPDHIIHVTCTGYISPSPAQALVEAKGWTATTNVTHAYHMGCYAAMPAIRMAEGFVAAHGQNVEVVHTEMCGLHMDCQNHSLEQIVVQSLFADGHVKYRVGASTEGRPGLAVLKIAEQIIANSLGDMTWIPAPWGMQMTLSRLVPEKIRSGLREMLLRLIQGSELTLSQVLKDAVFAVHPGGPKIIDAIAETLELSEIQVQHSREILLHGGNRSSATLPLVWKEILAANFSKGTPVISLAFGPGLTIYGALFVII